MHSSVQQPAREVIALILILFTAAYFRLHQLSLIPPGLYPDEAINGIDAVNAVQSGHFAVFYPANGGREGLFINLQALSTYVFGHNAWALRFVSACTGTATVLGLYLLVRQIYQNWLIAAIASFLMAVGFWHVNFSRIGFRAIMAPFFVVWAFYFLENAIRSFRPLHFSLFGATFGLGFYSYISYRIMPLVIVILLLFQWRSISRIDFPAPSVLKQKFIYGLFVFFASFIIITIPFIWYFINNSNDFMERINDTCICSDHWFFVELIKNVLKTLGMFIFVGDSNWRHDISGDALLVWPVALFFVLGSAIALCKLAQSTTRTDYTQSRPQMIMLSWLLVGLIPAILSDEAPHALRTLMVSPSVYTLAAEGLWWISCSLQSALRTRPAILSYNQALKGAVQNGSVTAVLVILLLGSIGVGEFHRYFVEWARNPNVAEAFAQSYVEVAAIINRLPRSQTTCVLLNFDGDQIDFWSPATIMFLTDTATPAQQKAKNIFYIQPGDGIHHDDCIYKILLLRLTE